MNNYYKSYKKYIKKNKSITIMKYFYDIKKDDDMIIIFFIY